MSRSNETYNGWTNYATWRVHLEMFDGMEVDEPVFWESLKTWAEDAVEASSSEGPARDYAMAFLSDVDWREIARHVNEANAENFNDDEEEEDPDPYAGSEWAGGQEGKTRTVRGPLSEHTNLTDWEEYEFVLPEIKTP